MTYNEAYNKIIDAYFKDEIKPMDSKFCFCGTLHGSEEWNSYFYKDNSPYSAIEYKKMEIALFNGGGSIGRAYPKHEDYLFKGMCAALEVLKQIHRERNENVDECEPLTKRKLELCK